MRRFLDTSVLVASVLMQHPQHAPSLAIYAQCDKRRSACAAHSLAETYATLTRLPGKFRMPCDQALLFLDDVRKRLTVVALGAEDYVSIITSAAALDVAGGSIYDALIAGCAIQADAEVIYSWNVADFQRLGPEVARRVRTP